MLGLKRALHRDAEVFSLLFGELGEFHADFFQMQAHDFFVEFLWQDVNSDLVSVANLPEIELCQDLIGK
jgi:hypothetical protein